MSTMSDEPARWIQIRHGQYVRSATNSALPQAAAPEAADNEAAGPSAAISNAAPAGSIDADTTGGVARRPLFDRSAGSASGIQAPIRAQSMAMEPADVDPLLNPGPAQADAADPIPDPAQAPAVDPNLDPAQAQGPAVDPPALRPYVADTINKPGAQRSQDERAAGGSTTASRVGASLASGGAAVAGFAQSLPVAAAGGGASVFLGGNPTESLAHVAQLAEITGIAMARNDPAKQEALAKALKKNRREKQALAWSMEAQRSADSGKVGDKTIEEILADRNAHTEDEVIIALQAHNHIKRRERNKGKGADGKDMTDAELLRASAFAGRTKQLVNAVTANVDLGVKGDALGVQKVDEYKPEMTMGTAVSPDLVKDGKVVARDTRPQNSGGSSIGNFFSSLNPYSSRPVGNTAKLADSEEAEVAAEESKVRMWDQQARHRDALRTFTGWTSGGLQDGYMPDEFKRKTELKQQISSLEGTAKSEKSARSRWYRPSWTPWGPSFNDQEQQRFDAWGSVISGQDQRVKESQDTAIAGHQSELDKLEAAKAENLGKRRSNWLPWKSGSYHFSDEEQEKYDALKAKVDGLTGSSQGSNLTSAQQQELSKHREDMHEMEQVRDTGLDKDQRSMYSSLQTSIAATKNNALFGLNEHDITARHTAKSEQEEMTTTLKTGLNKAQREELQKAKDEREEQRQFKKTGLNKGEREARAAAESRAKGVYREAAAKNEFLDNYGGQDAREVNTLARSKNPALAPDYRVGGLKHEGITDDDTKTTLGGWFAQAGRTVSGWMSSLGDLIKGRSTDAKRHIEKGDLATATAISASGLAKESAAFAGGVALPGVGGKLVRNLTEGVGGGVQGVAQASHALFNAGAKDQDQRDAQRQLHNRERHEEASENAIDWHGAVAHEGSHTGREVGMGIVKTLGGGASAYMNTDVGAAKVNEATEHVMGKAPDPNSLSQSQRNMDAAKKFVKGGVSDQGVTAAKSGALAAKGLYEDYQASKTGKTQVPALEPQLDSAQSSSQLEAARAAERNAPDAATRKAETLASAKAYEDKNPHWRDAFEPDKQANQGSNGAAAQPPEPAAQPPDIDPDNSHPRDQSFELMPRGRALVRRGSTAGSYNPSYAQHSGDQDLNPDDMAGTSASYAINHDRSGSEDLEELHPDALHDRSSGAAVEELKAENLGEEEIET